MRNKSSIRIGQFTSILLILFSMLLTGCDFNLDFDFDFFGKKEAAVDEPAPLTSLVEGLTPAEVGELLGEASGTINMPDQVSMLYNGIILDYVDGKLVIPREDVMERATARIAQRRAAAENPE